MMRAFRDQSGITLAEVLVAAGIVLVGLVALIGAMPLSTSVIGESNLKTTATFLAQQRLEQVKNAQWSAAPAVDNLCGAGLNGTTACAQWPDEAYGTIVFPGAADCGANAHSGGCAYRRQVRIADCSIVVCSAIPTGTGSINTLRQVTVTVWFRPLSGTGTFSDNEERVQLVTLVAQRS